MSCTAGFHARGITSRYTDNLFLVQGHGGRHQPLSNIRNVTLNSKLFKTFLSYLDKVNNYCILSENDKIISIFLFLTININNCHHFVYILPIADKYIIYLIISCISCIRNKKL